MDNSEIRLRPYPREKKLGWWHRKEAAAVGEPNACCFQAGAGWFLVLLFDLLFPRLGAEERVGHTPRRAHAGAPMFPYQHSMSGRHGHRAPRAWGPFAMPPPQKQQLWRQRHPMKKKYSRKGIYKQKKMQKKYKESIDKKKKRIDKT
jgi:hypothetical protein